MIIGITGANGFIGKNLYEFLTNEGFECKKFQGNVENYTTVERFAKKVDRVIHLARKNRDKDEVLLKTNILGTANIALACSKNKTQSISINSQYDKKDVYEVGNATSIYLIQEINRNVGIYNSSLMLPKVYGPGCKPHYNSFISTVLYSIAKGEEYEHLIQKPNEVLNFVHVNRVCKEIRYMIKHCNGGFHSSLTAVQRLTLKEIINLARNERTEFGKVIKWYSENM